MAESGGLETEEALSSDSNMSDQSSEEMFSCEEGDESSTTTDISQVQNSGTTQITTQTLTNALEDGSQVQRTDGERMGEPAGASSTERLPKTSGSTPPQTVSNMSRTPNPGIQNLYKVGGNLIHMEATASGSGHQIGQALDSAPKGEDCFSDRKNWPKLITEYRGKCGLMEPTQGLDAHHIKLDTGDNYRPPVLFVCWKNGTRKGNETLNFENLFDPVNQYYKERSNRVVVMGSPGSGKRELCRAITFFWAHLSSKEGQIIKHFPFESMLPILYDLNELETNCKLADKLLKYVKSKYASGDKTDSYLIEVVRAMNKNLLLLLCGYDKSSTKIRNEVKEFLRDEDSPFCTCSVLLTCNPTSEFESFDRKFEIKDPSAKEGVRIARGYLGDTKVCADDFFRIFPLENLTYLLIVVLCYVASENPDLSSAEDIFFDCVKILAARLGSTTYTTFDDVKINKLVRNISLFFFFNPISKICETSLESYFGTDAAFVKDIGIFEHSPENNNLNVKADYFAKYLKNKFRQELQNDLNRCPEGEVDSFWKRSLEDLNVEWKEANVLFSEAVSLYVRIVARIRGHAKKKTIAFKASPEQVEISRNSLHKRSLKSSHQITIFNTHQEILSLQDQVLKKILDGNIINGPPGKKCLGLLAFPPSAKSSVGLYCQQPETCLMNRLISSLEEIFNSEEHEHNREVIKVVFRMTPDAENMLSSVLEKVAERHGYRKNLPKYSGSPPPLPFDQCFRGEKHLIKHYVNIGDEPIEINETSELKLKGKEVKTFEIVLHVK